MYRQLSLLAVLLIAGASQAANYTTSATGNQGSGPFCGGNSPQASNNSNAASSVNYGSGGTNCSVSAVASAGAGYAASDSLATGTGSGGGGTALGSAQFSASGLQFEIAEGYTQDDVTAALGSPSGTLEVTMNAVFSGTLSATTGSAASAGYRINFDGKLNQFSVSTNSGPPPPEGAFEWVIGTTQTMAWDKIFSVEFLLNTAASTSTSLGALQTATAHAAMGDTLSFLEGAPVFDLPDFLTLNAPEIGIIDNIWTDPRNPTVVPLPASAFLFLSALAGLTGVARARNKRGQR